MAGGWRKEQRTGCLGSRGLAQVLGQASLPRSVVSYVWFAGRKWDSQQKVITQWDEVSRKLINAAQREHKIISSASQTKCSAALGLITPVPSVREKLYSQEQNFDCFSPWPQP